MSTPETTKAENEGLRRIVEAAPKPSFVEYEFHPIANIFPLLGKDEADELKADIEANGQREPIMLCRGQIVDGRNRYLACKALDKPVTTNTLNPSTDLVAYVISVNLRRRHLTPAQRGMAAAKLVTLKLGSNQTRANGEGLSRDEASKICGASTATIDRCKVVLDSGVPDLVKAVEDGKINAADGETIAKLDKSEQKEIVDLSAKARKAKLEELTKPPVVTPAPTGASDNLDDEEEAYIEALKVLKQHSQKNADDAVVSLVKSLQLLDFLKDYKLKKAA
jgi:ParB-like chromosome segregation protein Spo0J